MSKPTYEELEAQVKQLAAQLELSLAAERAWETTMMRVCGEDGPLSVAGKFNQLAAESAALKEFVDECAIAQGEGNWTSDAEKTVYVPATEWMPPTPATDSILASLRAEGANELCKAFVLHKDQAGLDDDDLVTVREATDAVLHCAVQLRSQFEQVKRVQS